MRCKLLFFLFIVIFTTRAYAEQCIESINAQSMYENQSQVKIKIDLDSYVDIYDLALKPDQVLQSFVGRPIRCNVNTLYSSPAPNVPNKSILQNHTPVWGAIADNVGWVIYLSNFINDNLSESINGLALSLVTFDLKGNIIGVLPLSTFSQYDGVAEKSSAKIDNDLVTICLQDIDFYLYDENANPVKLLDKPKVGECLYEYYKIENGVFKRRTEEW